MKNTRTRDENGYRNRTSRSGGFNPKLGVPTASRIIRYCKIKNLNKTRFVEQCVNERLDVLERELLEELSKEELIELYMNERGR